MAFFRRGGAGERRGAWSLLAALVLVQACTIDREEPIEDRLVLDPVTFRELPGWDADDQSAALGALLRSCEALQKRSAKEPLDIAALGGTVGDWRAVCAAAAGLDGAAAARGFFESRFTPYEARNGERAEGLFTGYFEPELRGAEQPDALYTVPLYARPRDLVVVDLGLFRADLAGERIAGQISLGALEPYPTRAEIDAGALAAKGAALVWVDNPIDAFFLHIQGSGRIAFEDGRTRRIAYAATNGHAYFPVGRKLIEVGAFSREEASMPAIRDWLEAHPDRAHEIMQENRSYVFFRWLEDAAAAHGPVGAQGVPLSAGRSLAVDRRFVPLTAPLWLDTGAPDPDPAKGDRPVRRLVVAQDTGAAIRGPVRGDVYWGTGDAAGAVAGRMKHPGRYWLLLPSDLDVTGHLD